MWSVDQNLDKLFKDNLNLQMPKYPIGFGRISRGYHMFVMFPPKKPPTLYEDNKIAPNSLLALSRNKEISQTSREYWVSNKSISTDHLLAILAISNSFMNLQSLIDLQLKQELIILFFKNLN